MQRDIREPSEVLEIFYIVNCVVVPHVCLNTNAQGAHALHLVLFLLLFFFLLRLLSLMPHCGHFIICCNQVYLSLLH